MAKCLNCGSHVTDHYRKVFAQPDTPEGRVRVCPHCDDKIRDTDGKPRDARSPRRGNQG